MIRLDVGILIGAYFSVALVFLMLLWRLSSRRRKMADKWNVTEHVQRCPYCGHIFMDHARPRPVKCPVCESYLEVENVP